MPKQKIVVSICTGARARYFNEAWGGESERNRASLLAARHLENGL